MRCGISFISTCPLRRREGEEEREGKTHPVSKCEKISAFPISSVPNSLNFGFAAAASAISCARVFVRPPFGTRTVETEGLGLSSFFSFSFFAVTAGVLLRPFAVGTGVEVAAGVEAAPRVREGGAGVSSNPARRALRFLLFAADGAGFDGAASSMSIASSSSSEAAGAGEGEARAFPFPFPFVAPFFAFSFSLSAFFSSFSARSFSFFSSLSFSITTRSFSSFSSLTFLSSSSTLLFSLSPSGSVVSYSTSNTLFTVSSSTNSARWEERMAGGAEGSSSASRASRSDEEDSRIRTAALWTGV